MIEPVGSAVRPTTSTAAFTDFGRGSGRHSAIGTDFGRIVKTVRVPQVLFTPTHTSRLCLPSLAFCQLQASVATPSAQRGYFTLVVF